MVQAQIEATDLQPPERAILEIVRPDLSGRRMLDIGVGGGRTTLHFAPLVADYVGIDYSEEMIAACKARFTTDPDTLSFAHGDVRDMSAFPDDAFDFILFSFNGIDYISGEDRQVALEEIARVGKPGGLFCFSTHNLQSIDRIFNFRKQFALHPKRFLRNLRNWVLARFVHNRDVDLRQIRSASYAVINDGAHGFSLRTHYIRPEEQVRQLEGYFERIQVFSLEEGAEIVGLDRLRRSTDPWLYFLCRIKA